MWSRDRCARAWQGRGGGGVNECGDVQRLVRSACGKGRLRLVLGETSMCYNCLLNGPCRHAGVFLRRGNQLCVALLFIAAAAAPPPPPPGQHGGRGARQPAGA